VGHQNRRYTFPGANQNLCECSGTCLLFAGMGAAIGVEGGRRSGGASSSRLEIVLSSFQTPNHMTQYLSC
jgi:hypothetical protein